MTSREYLDAQAPVHRAQLQRELLDVTAARARRAEQEKADLTHRVEALEKSVYELAMSCAALMAVVKSVVDRDRADHAAMMALVDPAAGGAA